MRDLDAHKELVEAIRKIKADDAVAKLAEAADKNSSADLRYLLVEGLALQGSAGAQKAVLEALDDKDEAVRRSRRARRALPSGRDRKLITRLEKAEKNAKEACSPRAERRARAITGEALSFALEWKGWWIQHKDSWKGGGKEAAGPDEPSGGDTACAGSPRGAAGGRPHHRAAGAGRRHLREGQPRQGRGRPPGDRRQAHGRKRTSSTRLKLDPKSSSSSTATATGTPPSRRAARADPRVRRQGRLPVHARLGAHFTIQKAFPGSTRRGRRIVEEVLRRLQGRTSAATASTRSSATCSRWRRGTPRKLSWKMDGKSFLIKMLSPGRAAVLIESNELKRRSPTALRRGHVPVEERQGRQGAEAGRRRQGPTQSATGGCVLHVPRTSSTRRTRTRATSSPSSS